MMAVGIADCRVQNNALCDALLCIVVVHSCEFADAVPSSRMLFRVWLDWWKFISAS